jgi:uncharacterized protein (DUF1330 family)
MTHENVVGVQVTDTAGYAAYREAMKPILARYGGGFRYDFEVAGVLIPTDGPALNRVFVIYFRDRAAKEAFFSDPEYLNIRRRHFEPSVANVIRISEYDRP